MAGTTPRYSFHYPSSTDSTNVPGDLQTTFDEIDSYIVMEYSGLLGSRPTVGIMGRRYYATDTGQEFLDNGTSWLNSGPINTANGNITTEVAGQSALAGSTGLSADAGHKHGREPVGQASDILPTGPVAIGGSTGKWTDAGHVHPGDCIGDIKASVTGIASAGWLVANGAAVYRTAYLTLYNGGGGVASWPWGQGDGSTTFNLPNLQDRVLIGAGNLYTVGQSVGSSSVTLSVSNLPPHSHGTGTLTNSGHTHSTASSSNGSPALYATGYGSGLTSNEGQLYQGPSGTTGSFTYKIDWYWEYGENTGSGADTISGSTDNGSGSSSPVSTIQPSAGVIYLIKVL